MAAIGPFNIYQTSPKHALLIYKENMYNLKCRVEHFIK